MTISEALRLGLKSLQGFFPVMLASSVLGVVSRDTLVQAATSQEEDYIGSIMDRDFSTIDSEESLEALMARLETEGDRPLLVVHDEQLVGVLNKDKLLEFLLVQGLRRERERFINDSPED
jgi:CBS domain-containing protein